MANKFKIIKWRKVLRFFSLFGKDSRADWTAMFVVFFALNIGVIWGSVYLLNKVNHGELFQQRDRQKKVVDTVSRERLERIIESYDDKEKRFNVLLSNPERLVDPAR